MDDTIAAIATPMGHGGIGIVRVSGPRAREIAGRIFVPKRPVHSFQTHRLYLGDLVDPSTGAAIDEVLLTLMKAPSSYTREDVVEINSHSGLLLLSRILQITLEAGARLARPGEFTFRAFMNGRIDLTQAEAVADIVHSKSERGLVLAARQIRGGFGEEVGALRTSALEILAHVEAAIDFPEEASTILDGAEAVHSFEKDLLERIDRLIEAHRSRKIWLEGIATVIVGRVNAGKSSLLNRLLNEQRALVTPIPGTTRDVIESTAHIEGIPFRLMDTAGLRNGRGRIESLGIQMTEQRLSEADLALVVIDQSRPLSRHDLDLLARARGLRSLIVLNKADLPTRIDAKGSEHFEGYEIVRTSALTGMGIDDLRRAIVKTILSDREGAGLPDIAPNLRQKNALLAASDHFRKAWGNMKRQMPLEIIAADLQSGLDALGEIVGKTTSEDVLDRIFSEFCIGK